MNIGLLLTYNEADFIEEMMEANRHAVDAIFVLDGSTDGTDRILAGYPEVELVVRDEDVAPGGARDFHRQHLLDAARERYGVGHWYTLMHGDEIFHDDPRAVIADADAMRAKRVNWAVMQFFLRPDEPAPEPERPIQDQIRWYSPFWVEIRQFRDGPGVRYREGEHGRVLPHGVGWLPYWKMPILKHYPYRSHEQAARRRRSAAERGFSGTTSVADVDGTTYGPEYRHARRFEQDFGDLERSRQGNLLTMLWRWKRWTR